MIPALFCPYKNRPPLYDVARVLPLIPCQWTMLRPTSYRARGVGPAWNGTPYSFELPFQSPKFA